MILNYLTVFLIYVVCWQSWGFWCSINLIFILRGKNTIFVHFEQFQDTICYKPLYLRFGTYNSKLSRISCTCYNWKTFRILKTFLIQFIKIFNIWTKVQTKQYCNFLMSVNVTKLDKQMQIMFTLEYRPRRRNFMIHSRCSNSQKKKIFRHLTKKVNKRNRRSFIE